MIAGDAFRWSSGAQGALSVLSPVGGAVEGGRVFSEG